MCVLSCLRSWCETSNAPAIDQGPIANQFHAPSLAPENPRLLEKESKGAGGRCHVHSFYLAIARGRIDMLGFDFRQGQVAEACGITKETVSQIVEICQKKFSETESDKTAASHAVDFAQALACVTVEPTLLASRLLCSRKRGVSACLFTFAELKIGDCCWPVAEADSEIPFCGEPAANVCPYCAAHTAIAYEPAARRRIFAQAREAPFRLLMAQAIAYRSPSFSVAVLQA